MAAMTIEAVKQSLHALSAADSDLATSIIKRDADINRKQQQIEEQYITTLARRQPVATDLRGLVSAASVAMELERIADHAVSNAKIVIALESQPSDRILSDIIQLGELSIAMLKQVMQAYQKTDPNLALAIANKEQEIDQLERNLLQSLLQHMTEHAPDIPTCTKMMWICHNLERIGDRATNIAERIVYSVSGDTIDLNG